jgi:hypothetical protein
LRAALIAHCGAAGYPVEVDDTTVRAAMRYSLDENERAKFAAAQARSAVQHRF